MRYLTRFGLFITVLWELFSSPAYAGEENSCVSDPAQYAASEFVGEAISFFSIDGIDINFFGCPKARFETKTSSKSRLRKKVYEIHYPIPQNDKEWDFFRAPIIHELAHIYQSKAYGSLGKMRDSLCIERIELGADFLTGFFLKNALKDNDLSRFQTNLELRGSFTDSAVDNHGRPSERTSAFRGGHVFTGVYGPISLADAYDYYQAVQFSMTLESMKELKSRCFK